MTEPLEQPIAIVGTAAIMPDAPNAAAFWSNVRNGRYSISEVPPNRWDPDIYYSADPHDPDKTYSKIGGWVREFEWDPIKWRLPVPPKVAEQMDEGQRWTVSAARAALADAGWPDWNVNSDNVAVIIGNAIGGEKHYATNMRIEVPEVLRELEASPAFGRLDRETRAQILTETRDRFVSHFTEINEDTMPGELANVIAGRVANLFNFRGPNFTTDAACASGLAAMSAAVVGLADHRFDAAVTGGIDRNMGVAAFVKFCKIGALSATGTRPFDAGADGFVMGEGAALFVLKRLEDAERDGDRIHAVIRGIAGSSDGKGKGITAPNPVGQKLAVARAWAMADEDPATASAVEAHGTSTRVGDATELESLSSVFGGAPAGSIALGSVKSNIGHLKAAAGTAGMFKMVHSLRDKVLAPSLNFKDPNPNVDWDRSPFSVNTALRPWETPAAGIRRAGVSAFGFGGTNFHAVLEEHVPGRHRPKPKQFAVGAPTSQDAPAASAAAAPAVAAAGGKAPLRGALVLGAADDAGLLAAVRAARDAAAAGSAPAPAPPDPALARAAVRLAVDYADAAELAAKLTRAEQALASGNPALFRMIRQQGVFIGRGPAPKVAFLYTGQGSQYVNMLKELRRDEPVVAQTFAEADAVMTPLLGRPLSSYIFIDATDPDAVAQLEQQLLQTEITQPAVLATDLALTRLLGQYGIAPDLVMGHSLGEYGALVAAGCLTFPAALEAVSARGREMAHLSVEDNGAMAAVFGPLTEIERIVAETDGYVVIANINSNNQAVVGGATPAVEQAMAKFADAKIHAVRIPVSHAFHTSIVAPASVPLISALERLNVQPPALPIVANVTGELYPANATTATMLDYLGRQVASPVQFVKGLNTLYQQGARVFVEVGPKRALHGFVEDVLGDHEDVVALFTNHPKQGDDVAFNQALCGLYASGVGLAPAPAPVAPAPAAAPSVTAPATAAATTAAPAAADDRIVALGKLFAGVLEQGLALYGVDASGAAAPVPAPAAGAASDGPVGTEPVVVTGAALGLPGQQPTFDDANIERILAGQQFITSLPASVRERMADMHITRLVKSESRGAAFETIDDPADVIKLAGRHAPLNVVEQFGVDAARDEALDSVSRLAIGSGFDALRDAGIPLTMRYKTTTIGTKLPDGWGLPEALRDDTGVIFGSAFPGYDRFAEDIEAYVADRARREHLQALEGVRAQMTGAEPAAAEVERLISQLRRELAEHPYTFDRRFLFRVLAMGHSQFAELIGARGPNTQINAACASTTQALSLAEDWIRAGRCRRVIVVSADDATGEHLLPWIVSGFLASGAAATDERVEDAATPFDKRRHGMIVGMGAAAFVVESAEASRERGIQPICEVLGAVTANSAFHGTRLDVEHIGAVMEAVVAEAEGRGVDRAEIARQAVFVSHETYTPARGGSASAEINALRRVFGANAEQIVITNTKGFTGHAMGAGIEDVVAIKALETGLVPPVPNYREPDPELGTLNLSTGGSYPVTYALRLAAGFGSQIAMALLRWTPMPDGQRRAPSQLGYASRIVDPAAWQAWLNQLSGHADARVEVDRRRLRIVDAGPPTAAPQPTVIPVPYAGRLGTSMAPVPATVAAAPTLPSAPVPAPAPVAPAPAATAPAPAVAPAAPAPAPAAATPAPEPAAAVDDVLARVTGLVSELTGYPPDLLDPDLDLEADLGVDTVKQAEVFAAVRDAYGVERDENLKLRDFPTLNHVAGWIRAKAGIAEAPATAAPAPSAAAPAPAATPAAPAAGGDEVLANVTRVVSELTGYPPDLLDPDLDLEADLGVDTVKQAEVFAAVREVYGVERDDSLKLRDFPTLNHVAGWIRAKAGIAAAPAVAAPAAAAPAPAPPAAPAAGGDEVLANVTRVVADLTGYPPDLLDPDLDLEADLGVDTVKQAEVFAAVREVYGVDRDDSLKLRDFPTLNHVADWIRAKAGIAAAPAPAAPAPAAPAATGAPAGGDDVLANVTRVVAELTGYPEDLLDPDLDLEADLGVDTVKQAEVFAAVREVYGVKRDDSLKLRDFPTLNHVAGWIRAKAGIVAPAAAPAPAAPAPAAPAAAPAATGAPAGGDEVLANVTRVVAELTGYPEDLLDPDLDLEADLGVDTVKQAEVFAAVREHYGVERDDSLQLRDFPTLNHVAGWIRAKAGIPEASAAPAAAAPAPAAPAAAPTSGGTPGGGDEVLANVTRVVAELTGYPEDLLDPDLDLEADLGVDTVKQAEVFAAVREHYGVERDDSLKLRDFPTLNHVAGWIRERAGIAAPGTAAGAPDDTPSTPAAPAGEGAAAGAGGAAVATVIGDLDAVDALPRRVPVPARRPAIERCSPTGVELDGARVVVMLDEGGVGAALVKKLTAAGASVLELAPGVEDPTAALADWTADGPITGVYWLPGLDDEGDLGALDLAGWREALRRRVKNLYETMRALWETSPFLVSATRLGGYHGYDDAGASSPLGGAVTGFTKSYKKERPDALVKAVDVAPSRKTAGIADQLLEETRFDPGCVEIGRPGDERFGVAFVERPFPARRDGVADGPGGMTLGPDTVFVVTGAAGSIVSAITADLAVASGGTFHLLDLTPAPDRDDPDLAAFRADREGLKATIAARMKEAGDRPTPVAIERELSRYERLDAALRAVQSVEAAGGTAHYHSVDLTDADGVAGVMADVRELSGRIDVLLHAAGLEISRNLPEKERREYDLVFDVKADGWFNVLRGAGDLPIGATVVFSSVAGRFGNQGQTDYSAANDLLCKITSSFRRTRPDTRGLAFDWTAWGGIGMATRGSIPKIMEMAGVQMLPPEAGVAWIRRELVSSPFRGEVIVAGTLGMMATEYDETGGVDVDAPPTGTGPMAGRIVTASVHHGLTVETTLNPLEQPFLNDHRIDGIPVLPGVMGMEAFAEAAALVAPERRVASVEDVTFDAPLKFYRDQPRTLRVTAIGRPDGDDLLVECTLSAERQLPGQSEPQRTVHFTGTVRMTTDEPASQHDDVATSASGGALTPDQVYSFYFHGPAYQVVGEAWRDGDRSVARLADDLPANHEPADQALTTAPRLAELCFQTAGLWQAGRERRLALPLRVGVVRVLAPSTDGAPRWAATREVRPGMYDCVVVADDGTVVLTLDGYETVPLPAALPDEVAGSLADVYSE